MMALRVLLSLVLVFVTACEKSEIYEQDKLVTEKDGVRLYQHQKCHKYEDGMHDCWGEVYFTTPCGDVTYTTREGKMIKEHHVNGTGCK